MHILFDSPLYGDIKPFFPSDFNPFFNNSIFSGFNIYLLCVFLLAAGVWLYGYKLQSEKLISNL